MSSDISPGTALTPCNGTTAIAARSPDDDNVKRLAIELAKQIVAEQYAQDPRNNVLVSQVIGAFLKHKRAQHEAGKVGPDCMYGFELRMRQFLEWFGDGPVSTCQAGDLEEWIGTHPEWVSRYTPIHATVQVVAAFSWATAQGMIGPSPYRRLKKPAPPPVARPAYAEDDDKEHQARKNKRRGRRLPKFLRWPDAMKLFDYCALQITQASKRKLEAARRDLMVFRVGFYLGLRLSEIRRLDVQEINLQERTVFVNQGKGRKDRMVRIPDKLLDPLKEWIGERTTGPLIQRNNRRLHRRTIHWRLAKAAKAAGMPMHVNPHCLRHSYACRILDTGGDIRTCQAMLGHSDLRTTAIYLDIDPSRFAQDVDGI